MLRRYIKFNVQLFIAYIKWKMTGDKKDYNSKKIDLEFLEYEHLSDKTFKKK
jgi:hypothetical protein